MIKDRIIALIIRCTFFVVGLVGLLMLLNVFEGSFNAAQLMYYTIQSNLLALLLFALLIFRTFKELRSTGRFGETGYYPRFEMVCVIDLMLTLIVYWVLLAPGAFSMADNFGMWSFGNLAAHLFTPLFCVIDYILFAPSKHLKYRDVYAVLIYPLSYVAFSAIAGALGYVYRISADGTAINAPYFFLDYSQLGGVAFAYIGGLVVFFLILSHGLYFLDSTWKKPCLIPRENTHRT